MDLPGSDVEEYIVSLDKLLAQKQNDINEIRTKIANFHQHIKMEQDLSRKFYSLQEDEQANFNSNLDDFEDY